MAWRPTIRSSQSVSSAGPFTATHVAASNLSVGSGVIVIFFSLAHLTASAPLRAEPPGSVSGRLCGTASWRGWLPGPVSRCVSAAGIRFSVIRFPPRDRLSSRSAHRPKGRTQTGLPRSARTSCDRGGCPLCPEDGGAHPRLRRVLSRRLPLHYGKSLNPATTSHHARLRFTRHQTGVHLVHPSGLPLAHAPGWNRRRFGFPPSFAPRRYRQRTSGAGTGHRARTWNYSLTSD